MLRMEQGEWARWVNAVADALSATRGIAKLSQAEVARRANIARTSYRMYERGERSPDAAQLAAIAEVLGVTFIHLMGQINRLHEEAKAEAVGGDQPQS